MSNLVPSVLVLDKGLNLQTSKIIAPQGSVQDTLNYEQVDFQGHKRIDGYTRYDGSVLSAQDDYYIMDLTAAFTGPLASGLLYSVLDDGSKNIVASVAKVESGNVYLAIIDYNNIPEPNSTINVLYADGTTETITTGAASWGLDSGATVEQHYTEVVDVNAEVRSEVESLPGGVVGLHWFRDRLYAVADTYTVRLESVASPIYPNDVLTLRDGADAIVDTVKVLEVYTLVYSTVITINTMTPDVWADNVSNASVKRSGSLIGTNMGVFVPEIDSQIASFFESRNEQQVIDEDGAGPYDFGWRFVDHGWEVQYENGISLFGSLPSLNQNIQGIGIQGPTSTTGNNGRPLSLIQKINILDKQTQVNGWKTTATSTSYLLDPDSLIDVDSDFIYADAFISWDGTTGQVLAPGITSSSLTEYSATATTEVDV